MPTIGEAVRGLQAQLFVGRQRELARFQAWLEAETLLPEILDVSGPGGVGKTALLGAFRRYAEQRGRPVVHLDGRDLQPTPEGLISPLGGTSLDEVLARLNVERPLLLLDTFEALGELSTYLREAVLAELDSRVKVVTAGRYPAGQSLTLAPHVTAKFNTGVHVQQGGTFNAGQLDAPLQRVTLTTANPAPAPGTWGGLDFQAGSIGSLANVDLSDAGGFGGSIVVSGATPSITNSTIIDSAGHDVLVSSFGSQSLPVVHNTTFGAVPPGFFGVVNQGWAPGQPLVDATNDCWESGDGPSGFGPGTGVPVSQGVNFTPWLVCGTAVAPTATHLQVTAPTAATVGIPFDLSVTALDASNNPVAGYTGTVHFTSSDAAAGVVLPADYTFTVADGGAHTFTNGVTLRTAGAQTVSATGAAAAAVTGTSGPIAVTAPAPATTATTLTSSANPSVFGQPVTLTATVTSGTSPATTGSVTFLEGTTPLAAPVPLDTNGQARFASSALATGGHAITAQYSGTNALAPSTASLTQTVDPAPTTTSLSSSVNPSTVGQAVTFTATVTVAAPGAGTPSGSVTFKEGTTTLGTAALTGGTATLSTSALAAGSHTFTASYGGDANFAASSGSVDQVVDVVASGPAATVTSLTSSVSSAVYGQPVTFTAAVSVVAPGAGTPSGSVTFLDGSTSLGTSVLSAGQATLTTSSLSVGSHSITARYVGDTSFGGSGASITQTVTAANTQTTPAPLTVVFGQPANLTAAVTATSPSTATVNQGSVTFTVVGRGKTVAVLTATPVSNGVATTSLSGTPIPTGVYTVTARYSDGSTFNASASSAAALLTVTRAGTTTVTNNAAGIHGTSLTLSATVSPTSPSAATVNEGAVTFTVTDSRGRKIGSANSGPVTNGSATATFDASGLAAGTYTVTTKYSPINDYTASSGGAATLTVS